MTQKVKLRPFESSFNVRSRNLLKPIISRFLIAGARRVASLPEMILALGTATLFKLTPLYINAFRT
ncbi:hypothetical protein Bcell_0749 [Evansella cellulosilytica DSM 2522]|uniref:Uncharacterized protein n=1 Tax=Evansella cellulosilytica (strain ATCC 21833 / DSM 2522 / FERM P-1141 / JCM 9156 / N-4) TaxID=649639 RepID=E6U026_EVAC2|nr:hypothetical protein Bcell_0749 [Evansella cellulosilytica DSM 2522]